jgi:hypothetical protein
MGRKKQRETILIAVRVPVEVKWDIEQLAKERGETQGRIIELGVAALKGDHAEATSGRAIIHTPVAQARAEADRLRRQVGALIDEPIRELAVEYD